MTIRIIRLGSPRRDGEGTRLGTVRRPPRGVPKADFAKLDWYDVWFPVLAPSAALMKVAQSARTDKQWAAFFRKYRTENRWSKASVGEATPHSYGASFVGVGFEGRRSDIAARPATGTIAAMTAKYRIGRYDAMDGFMSTSLAVRPRLRAARLRSRR